MDDTQRHFTDEIAMPNDIPKWGFEYHVLAELKRLNSNIEKALVGHEDLTRKYFDLKEQVSIIKVKVALVGSAFGVLGSSVVTFVQWLLKN
jgi:hypothetical protein